VTRLKFWTVLLLALVLAACSSEALRTGAYLQSESRAYVYLQPMSGEASRVVFSVEAVSAVRDDVEVPLTLSRSELRGAELSDVQVQLASGALSPGAYQGISIKVSEAYLVGAEGETRLLSPEGPVRVSGRFRVDKKGVTALFLTFYPLHSVKSRFRFEPEFALSTYEGGLRNLLGFVSITGSRMVTVFNKKTMAVEDLVATGRDPRGLSLDSDQGRLYVALSGEDAIDVFDVVSGERLGRIRLNLGDVPNELALTPDGKVLVSANHGSNTASIIDAEAQVELERVRVAEGPVSAVINPAGTRAFVLSERARSVSAVDLALKRVAQTLRLDYEPRRGAVSRTGEKLYVVAPRSTDLFVVDAATAALAGRIYIGPGALSVAVDVRTDLVYVGVRAGEVLVVDPMSGIFIDTIPVDGPAEFLTFESEENSLFVLVPEKNLLEKVNTVSRKVIGKMAVAEGAYEVALMGER
jgi:YVTN family beta-propeller protein